VTEALALVGGCAFNYSVVRHTSQLAYLLSSLTELDLEEDQFLVFLPYILEKLNTISIL
jgi:hypothetical protein